MQAPTQVQGGVSVSSLVLQAGMQRPASCAMRQSMNKEAGRAHVLEGLVDRHEGGDAHDAHDGGQQPPEDARPAQGGGPGMIEQSPMDRVVEPRTCWHTGCSKDQETPVRLR